MTILWRAMENTTEVTFRPLSVHINIVFMYHSHSVGERAVASIMVGAEKTDFSILKNEVEPNLTPNTKINLQPISRLTVRTEAMKSLDMNIGIDLPNLILGSGFDIWQANTDNKRKDR